MTTRTRMSINARLYRLALDRQYPVYPENLLGMVARLSDDQLETARQDSGATHRYAMPGSDRLILSYALPLRRDGAFAGVLVIEQASDRVLTLADQALGRLVTLSLACQPAGRRRTPRLRKLFVPAYRTPAQCSGAGVATRWWSAYRSSGC